MATTPRDRQSPARQTSLANGATAKKAGTDGAPKPKAVPNGNAAPESFIPSPPPVYGASLSPANRVLPGEFVEKVRLLEKILKKEVWMLIQDDHADARHGMLNPSIVDSFIGAKDALPRPEVDKDTGRPKSRLALLLHSYGGFAEPAYRIASLLKRRCGGFTVVIPRIAKSAATLLSLGADVVYLGEEAELGPLDAQLVDFDEEEGRVSALDEVQAVEALEQSATDTAYKVMVYLRDRTGKRYNILMPHAMRFAAEITKPLFEKIDAVRYSRQSRRLQEAQDYAERLLRPIVGEEEAKAIAHDLVRKYPTHGFIIDREEAKRLGSTDDRPGNGLPIGKADPELEELLNWFYGHIPATCTIGRLEERKPSEAKP